MTKEEVKKVANDYRSQIIGAISSLEICMDLVISYYFTNVDLKKAQELRYALISSGSFNFNTKIYLIGFILERFPEFKKKHKKIPDQFSQTVKIRNIVAHQPIAIEQEFLDDHKGHVVYFMGLTTEQNVEKISVTKLDKQSIKQHLERINKLTLSLAKFLQTIVQSQTA